MNKGTVLTIDDDDGLLLVIEQYLDSEGYQVVKAGSVKSAQEQMNAHNCDIILLDLGLPDGEGLGLITQFRAQSQVPIIVVSGKSDTTEKIICLEMGADDYLTKPFEMRELTARIKAAMRRSTPANQDTPSEAKDDHSDKIQLENWILDRAQYQVLDHNGASLDFTTGEFLLLEALVMSANRALSREQLFERTREGEFDIYDRAIDIQIARIRKKLDDSGNSIIKTVRGVGYMYSGKADPA